MRGVGGTGKPFYFNISSNVYPGRTRHPQARVRQAAGLSMAESTTMDDTIDHLLERYLSLLDEYTRMRADLNTAQKSMYHDLARASFLAERGIRYGPDYYDDRMQAVRRLSIAQGSEPGFFRLGIDRGVNVEGLRTTESDRKTAADGGRDVTETEDAEQTHRNTVDATSDHSTKAVRDPLTWFGLLTPMPLRSAQSHAVRAVGEMIPRLVSINLEMNELEIRVRRAKKRRAKAKVAENKAAETMGNPLEQGRKAEATV